MSQPFSVNLNVHFDDPVYNLVQMGLVSIFVLLFLRVLLEYIHVGRDTYLKCTGNTYNNLD